MNTKQCPRCKNKKEFTCFYKSVDRKDGLQVYCKDCRREIARERSVGINKYQKEYRKKPEYKEWYKKWVLENKDKLRVKSKRHKEKLRMEALKRYGNKCECCSEEVTDFLVIDHINGGGTRHRKELKGGSGIFQWLRDKKYPKGFRVLCHNCNWSIYRNNGICAHRRK